VLVQNLFVFFEDIVVNCTSLVISIAPIGSGFIIFFGIFVEAVGSLSSVFPAIVIILTYPLL
jgi:hypothetical protein